MPNNVEAKSSSPAETPPPSSNLADHEKDSLHILPLSAIPLKTPGLQKWHLTKNVRLETVVEIFSLGKQVSGQVGVEELHKYFDDRKNVHDDLIVLRKLASLNSYDVYTLRIQLRRLGVVVTSQDALQLSEAKKQELVQFMRAFTRPLIQKVYGGLDAQITDFDQLVGLFSHPDRGEALRNLQVLADRLQVGLTDIPNFLEEYGDVFLSMAYYRSVFMQIRPHLAGFSQWTKEAAATYQLRGDAGFQKKCTGMLNTLDRLGLAVLAILEGFEETAKTFWNDITMESFGKLRETVTRQHALIGGLLCGLYVKLRIWGENFLGKRLNPEKSAGFILSDMLPGLEIITGLSKVYVKPIIDEPPMIVAVV
ncbi:MAG: hypothetical protein HYR63_20760 [Proteobacteria bacterium]|nr:hypothetical protein [Pseudomonadota bacterium]MBI3497092.1 hypothetical protein [Pseudomonadota bacterium]